MVDYEKLRDDRNSMNGFINNLGLVLTDVGEGYAVGEMKLTEAHANPIGTVHGGVLFSMADTIGGASTAAKGSWVTTVSGNMNYLNPVKVGEKLIGEGRAVKLGRNLAVISVMIRNDQGRDIASATMTYHYLGDKVPAKFVVPDPE